MSEESNTDRHTWKIRSDTTIESNANPYITPASEIKPTEPIIHESYELARRDQRALNFVLDLLLSYVLLLFSIGLLEFSGVLVLLSLQDAPQSLPDWLTWPVFLFGYYLCCEGIWGKTVAKMITGTLVIDVSGKPAAFPRILQRTLIRFIPFEFISCLPGGEYPTGWHDRWSHTRVIRYR